jgi:hypothetical protein
VIGTADPVFLCRAIRLRDGDAVTIDLFVEDGTGARLVEEPAIKPPPVPSERGGFARSPNRGY